MIASSRLRRADWLVLGASFLLSLVLALAYPLADPDEGRNAEVAREMAADHDLVIPHLAGMPYLDKPPALFVLGALFIEVLGPTRLAVRLPAMLASLATLGWLAFGAGRLSSQAHRTKVLALTAGAPLYAALSAYVIFDMLLATCVTAVWVLIAVESMQGASTRRRLAMFVAIALGILVKGPVMLVWAIGGSLAAVVFTRTRSSLRWMAWGPGWVVVLAVAGGWFWAALQRHPEYAHYAFLEESMERMTRHSFKRDQPAWFVPAVLLGGTLPWSLVTPWRMPGSQTSRIAAGFVLFAAIFFTLSHSKLVTYLLPAIPPLAWWAAERWEAAGRRGRTLALAVITTPILLLGAYPWLQPALSRTSGEPLAEALLAMGARTVRYEDCYSPGTDFLLDHRSSVVSALGHPLTSNYMLRYRQTLRDRGQWRLFDTAEVAPDVGVIVRETRRSTSEPPLGFVQFHEDARFRAFRRLPTR